MFTLKRTEGVTYPHDTRAFVIAVDCDHIEAAGAQVETMGREKARGGDHQAPAFGRRDARRGASVRGAPAAPHFDENHHAVRVAHDEIELAVAIAHVGGNEAEACAFEVAAGQFFAAGAGPLSGSRGHAGCALQCGRSRDDARGTIDRASSGRMEVSRRPKASRVIGHNRAMSDEPAPASPAPSHGHPGERPFHSLAALASDAARQDYPASTLYVIALPIGNRADITVRALACLARVDAVAAEDTRSARQLLHHYGIDKPLIAAHRHNEHEAAAALVTRIAGGARIAYVSDAGTPGISDPGARLVAAVRAAGLRVLPIPGASALTTAVSVAGLPDGPIEFIGFLPARSSQAAVTLAALAHSNTHLVFYEAPHRIVDTLALFAKTFGGDRHCVIARELTKRFEAIDRCRVDEALAWITADAQRQRGEFVVIVEADTRLDGRDARAMDQALVMLERLCTALPVSEAASLTAEITGVSRKALYAEALRMQRDGRTLDE